MNIIDMSQFKTLSELQEYAEKLTRTNILLQGQLKEQNEKISHLESLLNTLPANDLLVDDKEIEICKIEINRLYQKSLRVPLDDKEVRNLEILVRTLATARGKSLSEIKKKEDEKASKNLPVGKLVELAKSIKANDRE